LSAQAASLGDSLVGLEKQLRHEIAAVSKEHHDKHDKHSGKLLQHLKDMDKQLRGDIAGFSDSHGKKHDEHASRLVGLESRLQAEIAAVSKEMSWGLVGLEKQLRMEIAAVSK